MIDADAVYVTDNVGVVIVEAVGAARTRVTLQIAIDPAGAVPGFITNAAQTAGVEQALRVLERAAQERGTSHRCPSVAAARALEHAPVARRHDDRRVARPCRRGYEKCDQSCRIAQAARRRVSRRRRSRLRLRRQRRPPR